MRRAILLIMCVASTLAFTAAVLEVLIDSGIDSFGDSLWWAVTTVSTVGYGDVVPETTQGRIVAAALMLVGIAIIPTVTSAVVSALVARRNMPLIEAASRNQAEIVERLVAIEAALRSRGLEPGGDTERASPPPSS